MIAASQSLQAGTPPSYYADAMNDYCNINARAIAEFPSQDRRVLLNELRATLDELARYLQVLGSQAWDADHGVQHHSLGRGDDSPHRRVARRRLRASRTPSERMERGRSLTTCWMSAVPPHCHLGLGTLYRRTGDRVRAPGRHGSAGRMCREMGMAYRASFTQVVWGIIQIEKALRRPTPPTATAATAMWGPRVPGAPGTELAPSSEGSVWEVT